MKGNEARELLGFPPNSRPTPSQVKVAYKRKVWESHPDRFPLHEKSHAESKFKLISEAYSCLQAGTGEESSVHATYTRVVRKGVPRAYGGRSNRALVKAPFFLLILGTVSLGGLNASRAYQREKQAYPSHNPFLP
ncbi:chaperone DnaJ-domain superfamily protein isoform X2 [Tasmannia lanceolata]|uniref:chaperone DnaJ-domain superfamily protein isoform X2 n=1 Tax=Tasmannia lanceolata TaxID=3420 RepID=UPI004064C810